MGAVDNNDDSLSQIIAILVLGENGDRLAVRYTPTAARHAAFATTKAQKAFEAGLIDKTSSQNARTGQVEIVMHKDYLTLYRNSNDLHLVVIGDPAENELLLLDVINALYNCLHTLTNGRVYFDVLACKIDLVFLLLDELVEGSVIYEVEPERILPRIEMSESGASLAAGKSTGGGGSVASPSDASSAFNSALTAARDNLMKGLFSGV